MNEDQARDYLGLGLDRIQAKARDWKRREDYYRGVQDLPYAPEGVSAEYLRLREMAPANWLAIAMNTPIQRLRAEGFRTGRNEDADHTAWHEVWQPNKLDSRQRIVYTQMMVHGRGIMSVWPNPTDRKSPIIRPENGERVHLEPDPNDPWTTQWVVKTFTVDDRPPSDLVLPGGVSGATSKQVAYVYDDVSWYRFERGGILGVITPSPWRVADSGRHTMGAVPFVAFDNQQNADAEPHSAIEPLMPAQDAINTIRFNTLLAMQYSAFRQRAVTGFDPVVYDAQGQPVFRQDDAGNYLLDPHGNRIPEIASPGRVSVDRLLAFPGEKTNLHDFSESNLQNYISVLSEFLTDLFAIGQVPPQYLLNRMANLPLDLDTVVPTPDGRTTMGEIAVGDLVFDPTGEPVEVVALSPIYRDRDCYRLTFDDGTAIVADAEHQWTTTHFANPRTPYGRHKEARRATSVVTTADIGESLRTSMGTFNHFIPVAEPHDGPDREFAIDPYVLGVWLGDGDRVHGLVTSHRDDADEMADNLRAAGELVDVRPYRDAEHQDCRLICIRHDRTRCPYGHDRPIVAGRGNTRCEPCGALRYQRDAHAAAMPPRCNSSFRRRLRDLDVLGNKHIPEGYFHGSFKQRLALAQGLMDTDGTVKRAQGSLEITLHDPRLAGDLHRLLGSLGHKTRLRESTTQHRKFGQVRRWRMTWSSPDPMFRLARKANLQRTDFGGGDGRSSAPFRRYIVACEPVDSRPVRCITVASDSHLFCVTDAFIATHNSGDALAGAESTLQSLVADLQRWTGEGLEEVMRLANRARGEDEPDVASEVVWADAEAKSFAQLVDGVVKLIGVGFPKQAGYEMLPGSTPQKVRRWMDLADQEAEKDAARDPAQALKVAADAFRATTPPPAGPDRPANGARNGAVPASAPVVAGPATATSTVVP